MERVRIGLIGTGTWGEVHAGVYARHPAVELAVVCDLDGDRAAATAAKYGAGKAMTDYRELVESGEIDAVAIVTPDHTHVDIASTALKAGLHALVEKPLATTTEGCRKIIGAAREGNARLMVDYHNRWNPAFLKSREAIDAGEVGDVSLISLRLNDTIFVPTKMLSWSAESSVLWFLGSHCADLALWISGDRPVKVTSIGRSGVLSKMGIDTADFHITTVEFEKGAVAVIENCWIVAETAPQIFELKGEIIGSRGTLFIDISHNRALEKYTAEAGGFVDVLGGQVTYGRSIGFALLSIEHFIDCVINDTEPLVGGDDGLAATRVVAAAIESARTGRTVELEQE